MLACGVLVAVVGLAQGAGIGVVKRLLQVLYASSHQSVAARAGRVTSLLGSWNSLGIFLMAICLICWSLLLEINGNGQRLLLVGILAISLLCLVASGSYAGILGLAIGLCLLVVLSRHRVRSVPVVLVALIVAIPLIVALYPYLESLVEKRLADQFQYGGWMPQTLSYRFMVWREIFIPAIRTHFPWAVYPTVPTYYAWQFEESQYILLLFRTGLVGFASFLGWILATVAWLLQDYRQAQGFDRAVGSAALALIIILGIAGLTNEVFSFAGTIDYLWIMLALVANSRGAAA
jgi:O-antigen ligase